MDFMYFVVENIFPTNHQTKYTMIETNPDLFIRFRNECFKT